MSYSSYGGGECEMDINCDPAVARCTWRFPSGDAISHLLCQAHVDEMRSLGSGYNNGDEMCCGLAFFYFDGPWAEVVVYP